MVFSKKCIYALRAILYVASLDSKHYVSTRSISDELKISFSFLTKILQELTRENFITSYRGPSGGVSLSRPAAEIKIVEIVEAIEGKELLRECVLGLPNCNSDLPCPLHQQWTDIRTSINTMLINATLEDLALKIKSGDLRISAGDGTKKNLTQNKTKYS